MRGSENIIWLSQKTATFDEGLERGSSQQDSSGASEIHTHAPSQDHQGQTAASSDATIVPAIAGRPLADNMLMWAALGMQIFLPCPPKLRHTCDGDALASSKLNHSREASAPCSQTNLVLADC